jgi:hypothetical protein
MDAERPEGFVRTSFGVGAAGFNTKRSLTAQWEGIAKGPGKAHAAFGIYAHREEQR